MLPEDSPGKKKKHWMPPFDFFGTNPQFFMNSEVKTVTWIGFLFTIVLLGLSLAVLILFLKSYSSKDSATISSLSFISNEHSKVDLRDFKQIFAFDYYSPDPFNTFKFLTPSYYLVSENTKAGIFVKKPLSYFDCSGQTFSGVYIKYAQQCL